MIRVRRRRLLLAAGALLAAPLGTQAQAPRLPVAAYVFGGRTTAELAGPDPQHPHARAFVHRLRELGWEDGRSVTLERYGPENRPERAQEILANLAARNVAVIYAPSVVGGTMVAKMAMQQTHSVPIVFAGGADPVAMGLVASLARPGGNVTGITIATGPEIAGKRLELLKDIAPRAKNVAYFGSAGGGYSEAARRAASQLGLQLIAGPLCPTPGKATISESSAPERRPHRSAGPMRRKPGKVSAPEMRPEYDFSGAVRGKNCRRDVESGNVVAIAADVHQRFKNSEAANDALRTLIRAAGKKRGLTRRPTRARVRAARAAGR